MKREIMAFSVGATLYRESSLELLTLKNTKSVHIYAYIYTDKCPHRVDIELAESSSLMNCSNSGNHGVHPTDVPPPTNFVEPTLSPVLSP